jgi:hypothetical protein
LSFITKHKNMKKIFSIITLSSFFLFACNNADSSKVTAATTTDTSQQTIPTVTTTPDQTQVINNSATSPTPVGVPAIQQPSATQAAVGMNPAHGQPGHRCEIPVGAPLNSAPVSQTAPASATPVAAPTMSATPATLTPSAAPATVAPVTTLPGMNPPHGQPGHDCAIKVGDPLKK